MQPIPVPATGGVNLLYDARRIGDHELRRAKNLVPTDPGILSKRGVAHTVAALEVTASVPSAFCFNPFAAFDFVVGLVNTSTGVAEIAAGTLAGLDATARATVPYMNDRRPLLVPFNDKVYCFPGDPNGGMYVVQDSGAGPEVTDFAFSTTQSIARSPRVAAAYKRRMVFANFGPGYENTITFADDTDPADVHGDFLANNGMSFRLPIPTSDAIVAMIEVSQSSVGTPMESVLLVLCQFSAFIITDEPLMTTDVPDNSSYRGNMQVNRVNEPCGCASPQTVVRTQYGVMWTGPDDVWGFNFGAVPVRLGSKIRPAITRCAPDKRYLMHAEYHNGFYRVAIAGEGQVPDHHGKMGEQWWLDLRGGMPTSADNATWWGPQVYVVPNGSLTAPTPGTFIMARDQRPDRENHLYMISQVAPVGFQQVALQVVDASGAYDTALIPGATGMDEYEAQEQGNEVAIDLLTKEYDLGAPGVPMPTFDKLWLGMDVDIWVGEVCNLKADIIIGDNYDEQGIVVTQKGFVLGVDALDSGKQSRVWQGVHIPRDPDTVLVGKTYQVRLYDNPSWPVPTADLGSYFLMTDLDGDVMLLTLTPGIYENIAAYLDELVTQMSTLEGMNPTTHDQGTDPRGPVEITHPVSADYGYDVTHSYYLESDGARSTRKIAASLGFDDTEQSPFGATGAVHTAGVHVREKLCAPLSIGGIILRVEPSGRSPS